MARCKVCDNIFYREYYGELSSEGYCPECEEQIQGAILEMEEYNRTDVEAAFRDGVDSGIELSIQKVKLIHDHVVGVEQRKGIQHVLDYLERTKKETNI